MTEGLHLYFSLSCIEEGNGNPLQCSCLENRRDGGAWWAAVCGVAQSRTRLKWLSSSSRSLRHYSLFLKHFSLCSSDWMDSVDLYQVHSFTIPNLLLNCYSQLFITVTLSNSRISVSFFFFLIFLSSLGIFTCWFMVLYFPLIFFFNSYFYLFIWLCQVLVVACRIFSCGMWDLKFPDQGLNPGPLHWELRVLTTAPRRKFFSFIFKHDFPSFIEHFNILVFIFKQGFLGVASLSVVR